MYDRFSQLILGKKIVSSVLKNTITANKSNDFTKSCLKPNLFVSQGTSVLQWRWLHYAQISIQNLLLIFITFLLHLMTSFLQTGLQDS